MSRIRTAIVGVGKVAHTHAQALAKIQQSEFVAVCGRDTRRTGHFAEQYGVQAYTDLQTMLETCRVEMLTICTPHPLHAAQAITAAQKGVHVLVEKPMALRVADCDAMMDAAEQAGVKLGIISQRRLYPPVLRMKQAIDAGKLGTPILGSLVLLGWRSSEYYAMDAWRGTWAGEGGGVLVNQAVHQLDLFQWLMGPMEQLFGYHANFNHPTIQVEDTAIAIIRFRNGALGTIVASNSQNPGLYGKIHIHGDNGASIGVQTETGSTFISGITTHVDPPVNDLWTIPGEPDQLEKWQAQDRAATEYLDPLTHYHELQLLDFLNAIHENRSPLIPGEEGRKAVALFEAIYVSHQTNRPCFF